jgi:hypothetical protein
MKSIGRAPKCGRASFDLLVDHAIKSEEFIVLLIAYYVVFMIAGDLAAYAIGWVTELEFGSQVSLIVLLALYFASLWTAWVLAVWMTEPPRGEPESRELA